MALTPIQLNEGTGGDSVGADDIGGVRYEVVKAAFGTEGSLTLVDASNPLPVTDASGATAAKQDTGNTSLASIKTNTDKIPSQGQALMAASTPVTIASNQSAVPISGTVTVDTSTLATSAKQDTQITAEQAIQTAVQIMDDWDESDRAKVNLIVGQAGIAAGTGVDGATVPRVSLATNVGLPAGSQIIGKTGIDQTTPGTTNLVALTAETTKVIGTINLAAAQTLATVTSITNNVNTVEVVATTIFNGKTTVAIAGTRGTLAASQAVKSVTIKALSTNTGFIYVGNASVTSANGFQLLAGESISMDVANLNTVNIDSSVSAEGVTYIGIN